MTRTTKGLAAAAVEAYFADLRRVRASGGATGERSIYGPLANLLNGVGATLKPKVFCVGELADQGAGHPDFGLYAAKQLQKGTPREGQAPERGVVEVKSAGDDAWLVADSDQVNRYWGRYQLVLVTNTRDFVLLGPNPAGGGMALESFCLADSEAAFDRKLETPRAFAREVGSGLGEYLCRALSHQAALTEPQDLAWLLASYARDGLSRVEAAGDAPSLKAVRSALEDALGVRFEGEKGARFFHSTLGANAFLRRLLRLGAMGAAGSVRLPVVSTGMKRSGICARQFCERCSNSFPTPVACNPSAWSRCWTGPRPPSTGWTGPRSSPASTRTRRCRTSTSRSSKPSTPSFGSSWASGTRQRKWCATWSLACGQGVEGRPRRRRGPRRGKRLRARPVLRYRRVLSQKCCAASPAISKAGVSAPSWARG